MHEQNMGIFDKNRTMEKRKAKSKFMPVPWYNVSDGFVHVDLDLCIIFSVMKYKVTSCLGRFYYLLLQCVIKLLSIIES